MAIKIQISLQILAVLVIISYISVIQAAPSEITLYNNGTPETSTFHLTTKNNEADLRNYADLKMGPGNTGLRHICAIGDWITYDGPDFTKFVSYITNKDGQPYCFSGAMATRQSIRLAGIPSDPDASTLNIFTGNYFEGIQTVLQGPTPDIRVSPVGSVYLTGKQGWTLYLQPNYQDSGVCLHDMFVADIENEIGSLPIKSARPGCFSKRIYSGKKSHPEQDFA